MDLPARSGRPIPCWMVTWSLQWRRVVNRLMFQQWARSLQRPWRRPWYALSKWPRRPVECPACITENKSHFMLRALSRLFLSLLIGLTLALAFDFIFLNLSGRPSLDQALLVLFSTASF